MQHTLMATANFEGIAVSFALDDLSGHDIDATFNIKASIPQSMEWVQRRNTRRVKVPIGTPVKIHCKDQAECFNVADISVTGLSYIDQSSDRYFAAIGKLHTDCSIILPDKSVYVACLKIINSMRSGQINRVGCEIKQVSYQLDTALQRLINQIDFYYQ